MQGIHWPSLCFRKTGLVHTMRACRLYNNRHEVSVDGFCGVLIYNHGFMGNFWPNVPVEAF